MRLGPESERWQLAEAMAEALNARDLERLVELTDPEVEFHSVVAAAEGRVFHGLEGFREWAESIDSVFDGFRIELREVHAVEEDRAVVVYRIQGTGRASGLELDQLVGQVWTWRDGRAWRNQAFTDPAQAFRAAGLDPDAP